MIILRGIKLATIFFCLINKKLVFWSRFKSQSDLIKPNETLYSFRHSGAIEIFKRTGSITKLQKPMGYASIIVSLTYLRGVETP